MWYTNVFQVITETKLNSASMICELSSQQISRFLESPLDIAKDLFCISSSLEKRLHWLWKPNQQKFGFVLRLKLLSLRSDCAFDLANQKMLYLAIHLLSSSHWWTTELIPPTIHKSLLLTQFSQLMDLHPKCAQDHGEILSFMQYNKPMTGKLSVPFHASHRTVICKLWCAVSRRSYFLLQVLLCKTTHKNNRFYQ